MRLVTLAIGLLLLLPLTSVGAEEPADNSAAARVAKLSTTIAPFVDAQTLAVVHADLAAFDVVEAVDVLAEFFHLDDSDRDFLQSEIAPISVVSQSLAPGANFDLFFVISFSDLAKMPLFVVMPIDEGAPAAPVALEVRRGLAGRFRTEVVTEELHGSLVTATPQTLARLKKIPPAPRPEIAAAFEAAGECELQVLVVPSGEARKLIELVYPKLPAALGGGPTRDVTQHLEWVSVGLSLPPNESGLRTVVQATSDESAQTLAGSVGKLVELLTSSSSLEADQTAQLCARIAPEVEGSRVTVDVTAAVDEVADYGTLLAPLLTMAQPAAKPAAK